MNIALYDNCKHWLREGGTIWLYSDPHFCDPDSTHFRKDYIGDKEQVKRINSKVGKNDTIIFLGDIGGIKYIPQIHGYKVLIMGNHDTGAVNYRRIGQGTENDNYLFDEVYEGPLMISKKILLSHEPTNGIEWALNIHGHDHALWREPDASHFNVCAEHINYTPICLKNILETGLLKYTQDIHRIAINRQANKAKER